MEPDDTGSAQRTFAAIALSLAIWYGYLAFFVDPPPEEAPENGADVTDVVEAPADDAEPVAADVPPPVAPAEPAPVEAELPVETHWVQGCHAKFEVTSLTGGVHAWTLDDHQAAYDVTPLWKYLIAPFDGGDWSQGWVPYGPTPPQRLLLTPAAEGLVAGAGPFDARRPRVAFEDVTESRIVTRGIYDGIAVTRTMAPSDTTPCTYTVTVTWENPAGTAYTGPLWIGLRDLLPVTTGRYDPALRPKVWADGGIDSLDDLDDLPGYGVYDTDVSWFGFAETYFGFFVVPRDGAVGGAARGVGATTPTDDDAVVQEAGLVYELAQTLGPRAAHTATFEVYAGPKTSENLEAVDASLGDAVELGFLAALAWPLLWGLKLIHGFIGNWGLAIIGLTFTVKLLFFRLTQKGFESSQKMSALQPQLAEIREQFADNPEEMNRKTWALMQEEGANPISGCLPMLLQMPVWFALYSVLLAAPDLFHAEFLYLKDLSKPDPYMALPAAVVGLMLAQQVFFMPTGTMDPAQARMMKFMPLVFGIFFFTFPAGLVVYIFVNVTLSILQQWYIRRSFEARKPRDEGTETA